MIPWEQCGLIILASGQSARFGDADKLTAPFCGAPLASYAAQLAKAAPFAASVSVIPPDRSDLTRIFESHGAKTIINDDPDAGQGRSLAIGVKAIAGHGCDAAFISLADMPLIRLTHLDRLRQRLGEHDAAFASDGQRQSPPALFSKSAFPHLTALSGDQGAKAIMHKIDTVKVDFSAEELSDIDTMEDLHKLEESIANQR